MDLDPDTINPDPHPWVRGVNTKKNNENNPSVRE